MKKFAALLLALVMVFGLVACSNTTGNESQAPSNNSSAPADESQTPDDGNEPTVVTDPEQIEDNMTSEDGKYAIAMVTDVGNLKDKSFNEGTWNGVKLYAYNNGLSYKYYQPANGSEATDDDRYDAYKAAIEGGAEVIVAPGFLQEGAMRQAAIDYPEVKFVFIDGYPLQEKATEYDADGNALPNDSPILENVAGISFQEEQCGYFAGYAVVKEGFTKLGFSGGGGGTNPACCRYGYGYIQGANAAAAEMGVTVDIRFSWAYGANYSASNELQSMIAGWYNTGTEIVFACGGSMFSSITAAAGAEDGYVIGVDVDQSSESDTVVTSAMKGLVQAGQYALDKFYSGEWSDLGGTGTTLGVNDDAVGLPTDTWSMENFSVEEYEELLAAVKDGSVVVDADYDAGMSTDWSNVNLSIEA